MKSAKSLFNPKTIAVVGVSSDSSKLGTVIYNNLLNDNFEGEVYPVNPKYQEIFGVKCYPSVSAIQENIDLAIIVIPAQFVFDSIKDCVAKKVKFAVIISAGFREVSEEGAELEQKIVNFAKENGVRIVGPNCLGVISSESSMNASFAAQSPMTGNVAFLSQSGAFNTALLDLAEAKGFGFKHFISLGNKSDVNELDLIEAWLNDESIKVIGAYIEEFENGRELVQLIQKYPPKPIILLHSGESEAGQKAAASHTGSIAGSATAVKTAMRQAGVIKVDSIEKMFNHLMMFSWSPLPSGSATAVITNAGGPGIIVTDLLSTAGLKIAELSEDSKSSLKEVLPSTASVQNPIDILGDALAIRYRSALEIAEKDPGVDNIIVMLTPQLVTQIEETARLIIDFDKIAQKPIIPLFVGEKFVMPGLERLWDNRVAAYQYVEEAVSALKSLVDYSIHRANIKTLMPVINKKEPSSLLKPYISTNGTKALPEEIVNEINKEVGLDLPSQIVAASVSEALSFGNEHGYPLVIKAVSEDVTHKTDQKLVYLNIDSALSLEKAFKKLGEDLSKVTGKKEPKILVQEMIKPREELIIGSVKDSEPTRGGFGHMLMFGKGGIHAEIYKDTATRLIGIDRDEIETMIDETDVSKIIRGHRNSTLLPIEKIIDTVEAVQKIVTRYPEIRSLDINPCLVTEERCVAVDIKIFI